MTGNGKPRPDYHDPTGGFAGAPPGYSALTLRLILALFGLVICLAATVIFIVAHGPVAFIVLFVALAAVAAVDIGVIVRRKRRGEPG
jgi:hypothetical protein